ncbi:MAG: hypothetical protein AAF403_00600 [Pseudomonadota bacterium]
MTSYSTLNNASRLTDMVEPSVFFNYMAEKTTEKAALWNAGIVESNPLASEKLSGGGNVFNVPFWQPLATGEPTPVSDDFSQILQPKKITADKQVAVRQFVAEAWSTMNYAAALAGDDPMGTIMDKMITDYWNPVLNRRVHKTLQGLLADNEDAAATYTNDMVVNKTITTGTIAAQHKISVDTIADALLNMSDMQDKITTLICHPDLQTALFKLNSDKNTSYNPSDQSMVMHTNGLRVLIDAACPKAGTLTLPIYTSYLVGPGLMGWGESMPMSQQPLVFEDAHRAGYGGGGVIMTSRRQFCLHPIGYAWQSTSGNPTEANLADKAKWARVFKRKNVPLVFLKTNG